MRRILLISYNSYVSNGKLPNILEATPGTKLILANTWLVATNDTAEEFYSKIDAYLNKDNDRVFVAEIPNGYQGWMSRTVWDWMDENRGIQ